MKQYIDGMQGTIEGGLMSYTADERAGETNKEQLIGATMLWQNIPYDEAKGRIEQALREIKIAKREV